MRISDHKYDKLVAQITALEAIVSDLKAIVRELQSKDAGKAGAEMQEIPGKVVSETPKAEPNVAFGFLRDEE